MKFFSLVAADRGSTGSEYDNLELQGNQKGWSAEKGDADAAGKAIQLLLLILSPASLPCGSSPHHYQHDAAAATRRHPVAPATGAGGVPAQWSHILLPVMLRYLCTSMRLQQPAGATLTVDGRGFTGRRRRAAGRVLLLLDSLERPIEIMSQKGPGTRDMLCGMEMKYV
jgi:hypothetical protein